MKFHLIKLVLSPTTIFIYFLVLVGNVGFTQDLSLKEAYNIGCKASSDSVNRKF